MSGLKLINNANNTITGGVYCFHILTHGDTLPWSGFAKFPDDGQIAKYNEDKTGGTKGWVKIAIGAYTGYINVATLA